MKIARTLNGGLLPDDYYALPGQQAGEFGPEVLTLQGSGDEDAGPAERSASPAGTALLIGKPMLEPTAETDSDFYRRKQMNVVVRHVSGDRVVAMVEIVSPGNKSGRKPLRTFVDNAGELLEKGIHLLIADLFPPGPRDPHGVHAAIWEEVAGEDFSQPGSASVTLAAYESATTVRAFVRSLVVSNALPDMPLFLEPDGCVQVPLEATYMSAFAAMPRRWRRVLEAGAETVR